MPMGGQGVLLAHGPLVNQPSRTHLIYNVLATYRSHNTTYSDWLSTKIYNERHRLNQAWSKQWTIDTNLNKNVSVTQINRDSDANILGENI
jgi:hypothetical protein